MAERQSRESMLLRRCPPGDLTMSNNNQQIREMLKAVSVLYGNDPPVANAVATLEREIDNHERLDQQLRGENEEALDKLARARDFCETLIQMWRLELDEADKKVRAAAAELRGLIEARE